MKERSFVEAMDMNRLGIEIEDFVKKKGQEYIKIGL